MYACQLCGLSTLDSLDEMGYLHVALYGSTLFDGARVPETAADAAAAGVVVALLS